MGDKTAIGWTDATWNPVTGCSKVSPGCAHCYAETLTARYAGTNPGFITEHRPWTPANAAHNVKLWPERLDQPLRWQKPRMVFVNSMSDLFHEQVPDEFILAVFTIMRRAEQHTFQVLTKRPERMRELVGRLAWRSPTAAERADGTLRDWARHGMQAYLGWPGSEPRPNIWLGVSIENRRYVHRADLLRETPAAVRFISAEPLLGPLVTKEPKTEWDAEYAPAERWPDSYIGDPLYLNDIDWLIVGGESGKGHRPISADWVRDLRDACLDRRIQCPSSVGFIRHAGENAAGECRYERDSASCALCDGRGYIGTSFFFKQWGGATPKAGGRELDGRTWDEMPMPRTTTVGVA